MKSSLANEYQQPSVFEAGPWESLPPKYIPRIEDNYFPGQVNLGIAFNEQEIRTFAAKYNINVVNHPYDLVALLVAKYCTAKCGLPRGRSIHVTTLACDMKLCLTFIDNYALSECTPQDMEPAFWRLEDLWHEAGLKEKQMMWHTSASQAARKGLIARIDPSAVILVFSKGHRCDYHSLHLSPLSEYDGQHGESQSTADPFDLLNVSQFIMIQATDAFHVLELTFRHAEERQHWEWTLYGPLGYLHYLVMENLQVADQNAVSMPYPQRYIMSTALSENFPPQGHTHVIPDTTHTLEILTTERNTTVDVQEIQLTDGQLLALVPTSDPNVYRPHPGSFSIKTLHLTLWEVKALNMRRLSNVEILEPGGRREIRIMENTPWAATNTVSVLEVIEMMCIEQTLLQALHTFHRYHDMQSVKLALVVGCYITVLLFKRPEHLAPFPINESVTSIMADTHRLSTVLAPEGDFLPTVVVPPSRMFRDDWRPSTALRFSLYNLYIKDTPGVSVKAESDIFHLADNALRGNPFANDQSFTELTDLTLCVFTEWYKKHTAPSLPVTPETHRSALPQESPEYMLNKTPTTSSIWARAPKRPRLAS